jgi:ABC-type multidrug transport system fused ATPase/permease subunit
MFRFRCFAPITGGRVSDIVNQESKRAGRKDLLPLSKEEDKIEQFAEDYKDTINVDDAYKKFIANWNQAKDKAADPSTKQRIPVLCGVLFKSFSDDFFKAACSKLVWSILVIFSIWFFVFNILDFIKLKRKDPEAAEAKGNYEYYMIAGFFATMYLLSIGIQQMGIYASIMGSKVKASLTTAIFKKMTTRDGYGSKSDVVSLVAKDVEKLSEACLSIQYLWSGIFETIAVYAVLLNLLGSTILPGLGLMCVFMPLQYCLGLIIAFKKKDLNKVSSHRISLMEEILRGIKLIKIYGWEASFFKNLNSIRAEEAVMLDKINRIKSAILGMVFCLPPLMSMVVFGAQEATGEIESVVVFTALSFFNTLRVPFSKLPKSLRDVLDGISCLERIQAFLLEPDLPAKDAIEEKLEGKVQGIRIENASLSYGLDAKLVLKNINLNIPQGSLVMVAGPVASGKSNLLKSILGELTLRSGTCAMPASKAYVPQTPWTALGTVRDNIVFGKEFDEDLYHQVRCFCICMLRRNGRCTILTNASKSPYFSH